VLILACIIIFSIIRGCNNNKTAVAESTILKQQNDSLRKKNISDSIEWADKENDYKIASQLQDDQITIQLIVDSALRDSLDKVNHNIASLIARYKPIKPNKDTSATMVPNEYIADCSECFGQLSNGRELVKRAYNQRDSLDQSYKSKINLQAKRINELGQQNKNLQATLTDAFEIAKKEEQKFAPRRILYFSPSILIWDGPLPRAIGAGFLYQDKQKRIVGAHVYGSEIGTLYEANVALPLSFKRR
jgi:hypothetical protein